MANANNKSNANANANVNVNLFEDLTKFTNVGTKKESIYKIAIFDGMNEKQRKSLRKKIRNSRDNIIDKFNATNSKEEKIEIANAWKTFATKVYKDINIIFEGNTTNDKAEIISKFQIDLKALTK